MKENIDGGTLWEIITTHVMPSLSDETVSLFLGKKWLAGYIYGLQIGTLNTIRGILGRFAMTIVADDSTKPIQYNPQRLANLCRLYIGDRSVVSFASEVGLSRSFVAHLVCAQLPSRPSKRSLLKFTDEEKAKAQNNIRREDILKAAGYSDLLKDINSIQKRTEGTVPAYGKLPMADAIARYYFADLPLLPMHMFTDLLVDNLNRGELDINVSVKTGTFRISHAVSNTTFFGIPAYCDRNEGIELMKDSVKVRLVEALCASQKVEGSVCFCILTDRREIYDNFCRNLPELPGKSINVLLTEDHVRFCEESMIGDMKMQLKR